MYSVTCMYVFMDEHLVLDNHLIFSLLIYPTHHFLVAYGSLSEVEVLPPFILEWLLFFSAHV